MEIEKKLKDARMNTGLTQEQVAEKIMVSRQTISKWENGKGCKGCELREHIDKYQCDAYNVI